MATDAALVFKQFLAQSREIAGDGAGQDLLVFYFFDLGGQGNSNVESFFDHFQEFGRVGRAQENAFLAGLQ